jgi:hypothetical protein
MAPRTTKPTAQATQHSPSTTTQAADDQPQGGDPRTGPPALSGVLSRKVRAVKSVSESGVVKSVSPRVRKSRAKLVVMPERGSIEPAFVPVEAPAEAVEADAGFKAPVAQSGAFDAVAVKHGALPWQAVDALVMKARVEGWRSFEEMHLILQEPEKWPEGLGQVDHARACDVVVRAFLTEVDAVLWECKPVTMRPCDREVREVIHAWLDDPWIGDDSSGIEQAEWGARLVRLFKALHRHRELSIASAKKARKKGKRTDLVLVARQLDEIEKLAAKEDSDAGGIHEVSLGKRDV